MTSAKEVIHSITGCQLLKIKGHSFHYATAANTYKLNQFRVAALATLKHSKTITATELYPPLQDAPFRKVTGYDHFPKTLSFL